MFLLVDESKAVAGTDPLADTVSRAEHTIGDRLTELRAAGRWRSRLGNAGLSIDGLSARLRNGDLGRTSC